MERCTKIRFGEMHACPVFRNFTSDTPRAACAGSASPNTMNGAWPPSSSDTRLIWAAAPWASCLPILVEPVKVSLRTAGLARNSSPTIRACAAVTRLTTPAGTPTSCRIRNTSTAHSGVCLAGLSTAVQPAARAGPSLRVSMEIG